jgi:aminoglycoside phosphotransferase family enzyme/predicted kinase
MLVILAGLPGTGKTTVAAALGRELGATVLSSDRIRAERAGSPGYSPAAKGGVYEQMFARAGRLLGAGRSVILDATFYLGRLRRAGAAVARRARRPVFVIEVVSPEPVVRERMARRLLSARSPRPAGFEVYRFISRSFEPVRGRHFTVDTADRAAWTKDVAALANAMRVVESRRRIIAPLRRAGRMRLVQTHISWVLLDGVHAWKIKKPVRFSFVDYRSLERRRFFCHREVRINGRLSPGLYLGIVPVREAAGAVAFGGRGKIVDHAVKMREMPQSSRLDRLVARGAAGPEDILRIVRRLCDFHARARVAPRQAGTPGAIAELFAHAFGLRPLLEREIEAGPALDGIRDKVEGFLAGRAGLFAERSRQGRIRHGHGDLRMNNIFVEPGAVHLFDAVEFNPALAATDVAADVATLAIDLRFSGRRRLAETFVDAYIACSGDAGLRDVADFYQCYRALVRLLVEALLIDDPTVEASRRRQSCRIARRYLRLADAFARRL